MPRVMVQVDNASLQRVVQSLHHMRESIAKKAVRKGLRTAGKPILSRATAIAPVEEGSDALARARAGTYKKSLGLKFKAYPSRGDRAVVVIGPRRGFRKLIGFGKRGRRAWLAIYHDPAKIAHLVERKHHVMGRAGAIAPDLLTREMLAAVNEVLAGVGFTL